MQSITPILLLCLTGDAQFFKDDMLVRHLKPFSVVLFDVGCPPESYYDWSEHTEAELLHISFLQKCQTNSKRHVTAVWTHAAVTFYSQLFPTLFKPFWLNVTFDTRRKIWPWGELFLLTFHTVCVTTRLFQCVFVVERMTEKTSTLGCRLHGNQLSSHKVTAIPCSICHSGHTHLWMYIYSIHHSRHQYLFPFQKSHTT